MFCKGAEVDNHVHVVHQKYCKQGNYGFCRKALNHICQVYVHVNTAQNGKWFGYDSAMG